jgi:hypothetical protein
VNTPNLPTGCRWTDTIADAATCLAAGHIPLARPAEPDRARRWAQVMHWYTPAGHRPPPATGEDRVVVSVGPFETIGMLAASALNRRHQHAASLADAADHTTPATSVLLVATAADCTLGALAPALDIWTRSHTRVGLLTGHDRAGTVFSLAKVLAARVSSRTHAGAAGKNALLDGPAGIARPLPHGIGRARLADALADDWLTLITDAHGSAAHAWLGTHVLCGLSTAQETTHTGHAVTGGCTTNRCKLSPDATLTPVHPHELRAVVLGLFVCNAIALGPHEQYPTNVCLALDALEGYPAAILGLLRGDADTNTIEPTVVANLLNTATSLGETARLLNQALAHRGVPHATLVLGDPDQVLPANPGATIPAVELNQETLDALPVIVSGDQRVPSLITAGRALLAAPTPAASAVDAQPDATDLLDDLHGWTSRLTEAQLLEDALSATSTDTAVTTHLATLRTIRDQATHLVLATSRHLEQLHRHRAPGLPTDPRPRLDQLAQHWASTVATLSINSPSAVFSHLTEALTAHHHLNQQTPAGPCDQCGAPRSRLTYTGPTPVGNRTELRCPRCGLLTSNADNGCTLILNTPPQLVPGQPTTLQCTLDGDRSATGVLSAQLRPRSASRTAYASSVRTASGSDPITITLDVPQDTEPELHRAWILLTSRFQLSLALTRIPAVPLHDTESAQQTKENR